MTLAGSLKEVQPVLKRFLFFKLFQVFCGLILKWWRRPTRAFICYICFFFFSFGQWRPLQVAVAVCSGIQRKLVLVDLLVELTAALRYNTAWIPSNKLQEVDCKLPDRSYAL